MPDIAAKLRSLRSRIPGSVKLIAVSKTKPVSDILEAYNSGQRIFGENRVQEILRKKDLLPKDIEWHMIGHLQTNKVKMIVPFISMIQSVDSLKLLTSINQESARINKITNCLLEIFIAGEETKSGFSTGELFEALESSGFDDLKNVRICGVMGMATFTDDREKVRNEFRNLAGIYKIMKERYFSKSDYFKEISMGMSGDYNIAVEEGSTMVRIGSLLFGERIKS